jgi:hypothetical protein
MVQPKPLAGCVDQSSAHIFFLLSSSFILKLCPPVGPFSFPPILSSFSFFLMMNSSQYYQVSTYQYLRYLPVLPYQYSPVPADRRQVQPQEAAVQPLQVAVQQVPADRCQVQPLQAAVHQGPADRRQVQPLQEAVHQGPADRRQVQPLLAAVQPSPADGCHAADQEQEEQQGQ